MEMNDDVVSYKQEYIGRFNGPDLNSEHGILVELVRIVKELEVEKDGRKVGELCRWRDEVLKMAVGLIGEDDDDNGGCFIEGVNNGDCEGNGWYRCCECIAFCGKRGGKYEF